MNCTLTLFISFFVYLISFAQTPTVSVNRYAKLHEDKKYIITEYTYEDGHLDNYITSVPSSEFQKLKIRDASLKNLRNIEWDQNPNLDGLQFSLKDKSDIENAFNNAISQTEDQLNLERGSLGDINLPYDFLKMKKEHQSLMLINKVITSLSKAEAFAGLIEIEGVDKSICADSKKNAKANLGSISSETVSSAEKIGYENVEYSEHFKNDGIFLTNGVHELRNTHIRALYNWIFADQYTGWYNRTLILNRKLNDDFNEAGTEGFMGIASEQGILLNEIIDNPTLTKAVCVVFQLIDPLSDSSYVFELIEEKPSLSSVFAAEE